MWRELADLAREVPATFWGVLAGSVFTLLGVTLSNRSNDKRLSMQLMHDKEMKAKERDLALRKEIYLAAAEAVQAGFYAISRFANIQLANEDVMQGFSEKAPAIAKVHVVATLPTAKAFVAFMSKFADAVGRLSLLRVVLLQKKVHEDVTGKTMEQVGNDVARWVEEMRQYNLAGVQNPQRWQVIQGNFEVENKRYTEAIADHRKAVQERGANAMEVVKVALAENAELQRLVKPIVVAVRNELELAIDERAYAEVLDAAAARGQARMQEFFDGLVKLLPKEKSSPMPPKPPARAV